MQARHTRSHSRLFALFCIEQREHASALIFTSVIHTSACFPRLVFSVLFSPLRCGSSTCTSICLIVSRLQPKSIRVLTCCFCASGCREAMHLRCRSYRPNVLARNKGGNGRSRRIMRTRLRATRRRRRRRRRRRLHLLRRRKIRLKRGCSSWEARTRMKDRREIRTHPKKKTMLCSPQQE